MKDGPAKRQAEALAHLAALDAIQARREERALEREVRGEAAFAHAVAAAPRVMAAFAALRRKADGEG